MWRQTSFDVWKQATGFLMPESRLFIKWKCAANINRLHIYRQSAQGHTQVHSIKKHSHFQLVKNPSNSITSFKSWILSIGFVCLLQLSFRICCLVLKHIKDTSQARTKTDLIWASSGGKEKERIHLKKALKTCGYPEVGLDQIREDAQERRRDTD